MDGTTHAGNAVTQWDAIRGLSNEDRERAWNEARQELAGKAVAELSLCECAAEVGSRWPYLRGEEPLDSFLGLDWNALRGLRGFGRRKTDDLLEIVRALTRLDTATVRAAAAIREPVRAEISAADGLAALGIPLETPCELLFVSGRARNLLRRDGRRTVGALLEYLTVTDAERLRRRKGVGRGTVTELYGLLTAVTSIRADLVREFLPLRTTGSGLCFSAFAKHLLCQEEPQHRDALFAHFAERDTLRAAGQRIGKTRQRVSQLVSALMRRLDRGLAHFPEEKHNLWDAWQRCEGLDLLLDDDLDGSEKLVVAGALDRVFADSPEGKAILSHRKAIFDSRWADVRNCDEFYFGGLRAARFVRDRGEPQLLQRFLDYLEGKPGVDVSRTAGRACSSRQSLRPVVRAIVCSSTTPLGPVEILDRLRSEGLFGDLDLDALSRKVRHWVDRGTIPAEKIVWASGDRRNAPDRSNWRAMRGRSDSEAAKGEVEVTEHWYLRSGNGHVFGPVDLRTLCDWAAACRIGPEHEVSQDRRHWIPAPELGPLKLEWVLEFAGGRSYGPVHLRAIDDLVETVDVKGNESVANVRTGERWLVSEMVATLRRLTCRTVPGADPQ